MLSQRIDFSIHIFLFLVEFISLRRRVIRNSTVNVPDLAKRLVFSQSLN